MDENRDGADRPTPVAGDGSSGPGTVEGCAGGEIAVKFFGNRRLVTEGKGFNQRGVNLSISRG